MRPRVGGPQQPLHRQCCSLRGRADAERAHNPTRRAIRHRCRCGGMLDLYSDPRSVCAQVGVLARGPDRRPHHAGQPSQAQQAGARRLREDAGACAATRREYAEERKRRTYPELQPHGRGRCRLVVFGLEVEGGVLAGLLRRLARARGAARAPWSAGPRIKDGHGRARRPHRMEARCSSCPRSHRMPGMGRRCQLESSSPKSQCAAQWTAGWLAERQWAPQNTDPWIIGRKKERGKKQMKNKYPAIPPPAVLLRSCGLRRSHAALRSPLWIWETDMPDAEYRIVLLRRLKPPLIFFAPFDAGHAVPVQVDQVLGGEAEDSARRWLGRGRSFPRDARAAATSTYWGTTSACARWSGG